MRFAFLADVPGWAFCRTGQALEKYGQAPEHSWVTHYAQPRDFEMSDIESYDLVRVGGLPLFVMLVNHELIPLTPRKYVPTIASFWDESFHLKRLRELRYLIAAIIVNDLRLAPGALSLDRPVIYAPDNVDPAIFSPTVDAHELRAVRMRQGLPLRVGWAGSEHYWAGIKHVDQIAEACRRTGCEFVRQDREKDGQKTAEEMADWYQGIDVYVAFNEERTCTPVPVLEALSCGVPVITTRCGDIWHMIAQSRAGLVLESPDMQHLEAALRAVRAQRARGESLWVNSDLQSYLQWPTSGLATAATATMTALVEMLRVTAEDEKKP